MKGEHIIVVGAGLLGRLTAWQLVLHDAHVTLLDQRKRADRSAASYVAAGMLSPWAELEVAERQVFELGCRSLQLWPQWLAALGRPVRFDQRGSLIVAHGQDRPELARLQLSLQREARASDWQRLDASALAALEPALRPHFNEALHFPQEAWISPADLMQALEHALLDQGVDWQDGIEVQCCEAGRVHRADATLEADLVIDCRGLGAKSDIPALRGVRGELIWLQCPEVKISRPVRLLHPRYRLYLVPTQQDDQYIVGASQIESDDDSPLSVRSALELLSAAYTLNSGFAEARIIATRTQCRPALKHNQPLLDIQPELIRANGLFRHGYLLAPAVVENLLQGIFHPEQHRSSLTAQVNTAL